MKNLCKVLYGIFLILFLSCQKEESMTTTEPEMKIEEVSESFLPLIKINTNSNTIVDEPKVAADMQVLQDDKVIEEYKIGIEIRGSSSQMFEKKSYGFETWDENGDDINVSVGGFPEEEDWILYGPYSDKSLLRNVLIFDLSNKIGRYATKTAFYELEINEEFLGTYVLMEKIKRDDNRVPISKNKKSDVSGGYILKIDKPTGDGGEYNESNSFRSRYNPAGEPSMQSSIYFLYEYPDFKDIEEEQKMYIQNYMHGFESALKAANFTDPNEGYRKYIDVPSFIDFFILNELTKNIDAFRLSTFMYKDKGEGEKLKMGPIWDFNLAFGNVDFCRGEVHTGWAYQFNSNCPDAWQAPFWWPRFMEDPDFVRSLKTRWNELHSNTLSTTFILNRIAFFESQLTETKAIERNFDKWNILGKNVWPNSFVGNTYAEERDHLKSWIENRLRWMDESIGKL